MAGAADPIYAATPNVGRGTTPATLDTSLTGPTNYTTVFTAGANGSKVEEIWLQGLLTTAAGVVNLFIHDGAAWSLIDPFLITAVTSSTTAVAHRMTRKYDNLFLQAGWTLRVSTTINTNQSGHRVTVFGGDF